MVFESFLITYLKSPLVFVGISAVLSFLAFVDGQTKIPLPAGASVTSESPDVINDETIINLRMTGALPTKANATICQGFTLTAGDQFWIFDIAGVADWSTVHHIGLYGCDAVPEKPCGCAMPNRSPMYAWSRYTNRIRMTGSGNYYAAGFRVGGTSDNQFLFIESHYHDVLTQPDTSSGIDIRITRNSNSANMFDAMVYTFLGLGTIPADTSEFLLDTCATMPSYATSDAGYLQYMGHQAHSHNLGRLVSAYQSSSEYGNNEIGRGKPIWPQTYRASAVNIRSNYLFPGDTIYSRCYYTSTGVSSQTSTIGPGLPKTPWMEMCISNILFVASNPADTVQLSTKNAYLKGTCNSTQSAFITATWPKSKQLLPENSILDSAAVNGGNTGVVSVSSDYSVNLGTETFTGVIE